MKRRDFLKIAAIAPAELDQAVPDPMRYAYDGLEVLIR